VRAQKAELDLAVGRFAREFAFFRLSEFVRWHSAAADYFAGEVNVKLRLWRRLRLSGALALCTLACLACLAWVAGCNSRPAETHADAAQQAAAPSYSTANIPTPKTAPAPDTVDGFDGTRAFEHVRHLVELGPRPPQSDAIHAAQAYIVSQLKSYGCPVEERDFKATSSLLGELQMKNIIAKIPGASPNIVVLATHYDTVRLANFVGADDSGSGTGTMLELARVLCSRTEKPALTVWIAFFDGEEAQGNWTGKEDIKWDLANATFGSRELAAEMALSGDLKNTRAMILTDMIGPSNLKIKRDTTSTPWVQKAIWKTADRLGYSSVFINEDYAVGGDDHFSFIKRGVPAYDIIDFSVQDTYWHTADDTLEKVDPKSLAIVGHVLIEVIPELAKHSH
jgi:glutaminyl-peptide cyclotransferase